MNVPETPPYIDQLRNELLDLGEDAMLFEELDGFVAGIVVCPEPIPPSEWLPVILGIKDDKEARVFETLKHANSVIALVMEYFNYIAVSLSDGSDSYSPLITEDRRTGEILWELWIVGFEKATKLRPTAWLPLLDEDIEVSEAIRGLLTLIDVARSPEIVTDLRHRELDQKCDKFITQWVLALNEWRLEGFSPAGQKPFQAAITHGPFDKVGRNEPCPCGSGKKYKACCVMN